MRINVAGIIERKITPVNGGRPYVDISTTGLITLYNIPGRGLVKLFGLDGRVLYRCSFITRESAVTLLQQARLAGRTFILRVSRPDGKEILSRVIRLHR